ncbi:hypothetical protein OPQ81_009220 [Rhizoctonia solani]|nr:hypothetical protein OPQ81_009220 [Rhizoctonia solani]
MDSESNCACQGKLNPDITGIGVRVALYIQILVGWFASLIWRETFVKNSRTAYMTALALLIASFIELTTQSLSLLDGIVVSFTTTMMITFAIASYSRLPDSNEPITVNGDIQTKSVDSQKSFSRWIMQCCFVVFWGAWCFNMWRDPAHFGLKGDAVNCDTNYKVIIQLFGQVHATDPHVRNAALALVAIGFAVAFLSLFMTLEQFVSPFVWIIRKIKGKKEPIRGIFTKYDDDPTLQSLHVFFQAITIGTFIFLIYATEKTIKLNDTDGQTRDWSYGQTIALILLLQQIMDLFSTFIEEREKAEEERERAATAHGDTPGFPGFELPIRPLDPNDQNKTDTVPTTPGSK